MLSGKFLLQGQLPWKDDAVICATQFILFRDQLLQGKFVDASKTLKGILDQEGATDQDKLWANLFLSYTRRLTACHYPGQEKAGLESLSVKHYIDASQVDSATAFTEAKSYGLVTTWMGHLLRLPIKKSERPSFPFLHEQVWQCLFTEIHYHQGLFDQGLECANQSLAAFPLNHFLLFSRSALNLQKAIKEDNPSLMAKAEEDLSRAIVLCPKVHESRYNLSRYYFHRAQVRYFRHDPDGVMDDFLIGLFGDDHANDAFDNDFRAMILRQVLAAQSHIAGRPGQFDEKKNKALSHLHGLLTKDCTNCNLFIKRARRFEELQRFGRAYFEYLIAQWLIKTKMSAPKDFSLWSIEEKLEQLKEHAHKKKSPELKESQSQENEEEKLERKRKKRERQKKEKEEKKAQEGLKQLSKDFASGLIAKVLTGLDEKERKEQAEKKAREIEEKRNAEAIWRFSKDIVSLSINNALKQVEEQIRREERRKERVRQNEMREAKERKDFQELVLNQETIIFSPDSSIEVPQEIAVFIRAIKAVEGRLAKRCHLYGGAVRDQVLGFKREGLDFDVRAPLPLNVVARVMKEIFHLPEEPKVEHNLVQITIAIMDKNTNALRQAVLAVSYSEALANESLSYTEAVREDALSLDFIQNAFIATVPEQGTTCPVYYPLAWWDIYYAQDPRDMVVQLERARNEEGLMGSLHWMRGHAIFLVGTGPALDVFYLRRNSAKNPNPFTATKMEFTVFLQADRWPLLFSGKHGRIRMTPYSQPILKEILDSLNEKCLAQYQFPLDSLKSGVVSIVANLPQLGTILNAKSSFQQDPICMLRAIHLTTALDYEGLNHFVLSGIAQNKQAFRRLIKESPGKLNSWFNKLICKDGRPCLIDNMYLLLATGLLGLAFPELVKALRNKAVKTWMDAELIAPYGGEKPSLNYFYCVFALCVSVNNGKHISAAIAENPLWAFNFKNFFPYRLMDHAAKSWSWSIRPQQSMTVNVISHIHFHCEVPERKDTPSPISQEGCDSRESPRSELDEQEPGLPQTRNRKVG